MPKRKKNKKKDLLKKIKQQAGRLDTPAPKIFGDKSKYTRKQKYRRNFIHDEGFLRFFFTFILKKNRKLFSAPWHFYSVKFPITIQI